MDEPAVPRSVQKHAMSDEKLRQTRHFDPKTGKAVAGNIQYAADSSNATRVEHTLQQRVKRLFVGRILGSALGKDVLPVEGVIGPSLGQSDGLVGLVASAGLGFEFFEALGSPAAAPSEVTRPATL